MKKIQTPISLTFHKHLCWLIYIDRSKNTNKHKQTQTQETLIHIYSHILTSKHTYTYINICIHIYTYINIDIHTHIYIHA